MTLEEQIAVIHALPRPEQEALSNVCVGLEGAPADLLRSLMRKGLIVRRRDRYDVASYWVHYAWCEWCSRQEADETLWMPDKPA